MAFPAHLFFETAAYATGWAVYRHTRRRRGDGIDDDRRWVLIAAAVLGAALGSKVLHHLSAPELLARRWRDPLFLLGGKTIVGGLLGGLVAVETTKKVLGIGRSTGDLYALALCVGLAVGRIGCFLAGLDDGTHGVATALPWGVDLGDGIPRHPVALYEIGFLCVLAPFLARRSGRFGDGSRFRELMVAYLAFRFLVDFLKPYETILGLGGIQWACLAGLGAYAAGLTPTRDTEASNRG